MSRLCPLVLLAILAAGGCRSFEERPALFPRLRDALDGERDDDRYADRFRDRYTLPPAVATNNSCLPCSGGGYPSGLTLGTPTVIGGGYALPTGYSSPMAYSSGPVTYSGTTVPAYSSGPILGQPVYPSGPGNTFRPRRDDELPAPGGYSTPGATDVNRSVAPRPPGLPVGR
ncbi:MAG: hypothetical protein MUF18_19570 [Fimbriiglobus sp.]|jgi:hypothetical protein|nr:hypothetical protein [Fimbriiglobus sp.]